MNSTKILIVGHRGALAYEPENTLRGFAKAVALGVDAIEFDVMHSKDHIPVVFHDETLERTTNGKGKVEECTLQELKQLDAGKGERIPTLEEAIAFIKQHHVRAAIELKTPHIAEHVAQLIRKHGIPNDALIISEHPEALRIIATTFNDLSTGLIFWNPITDMQDFFRHAKELALTWLCGECGQITEPFVEQAHTAGFKVGVWVVNDAATAKKYAAFGVDALISDKPDVLHGL